MAVIRHKRSTTGGAVPAAGALETGELAINVADGKVFTKKSDGSVVNVTADGHTHALSTLTGVSISSPSSGQVLKYNGTNWINDTDATGGGGSVTAEDDQIILAMRVFA